MEDVFGPHVDFAQVLKVFAAENPGQGRDSPPRVSEVIPTVLGETPDPRFVSPAYVEPQNLTTRMALRRFSRLTNAFSKKLESLRAALNLHFCWYNLVRIHKTLRVTPAMAAGASHQVSELRDLVA